MEKKTGPGAEIKWSNAIRIKDKIIPRHHPQLSLSQTAMYRIRFDSETLLQARAIIRAAKSKKQSREDVIKKMEEWKSTHITKAVPFIALNLAMWEQSKKRNTKQELIDALTVALDMDSQDGIFNVAEKAAQSSVDNPANTKTAAVRVLTALDAREKCGFDKALQRYEYKSDVNAAFRELLVAAKDIGVAMEEEKEFASLKPDPDEKAAPTDAVSDVDAKVAAFAEIAKKLRAAMHKEENPDDDGQEQPAKRPRV